MELDLFELSAIFGSLLFLASFLYINREVGAKNDLFYAAMNVLAASLMLLSLFGYWNIGVLINNAAWVVIGSYSLLKHRQAVANVTNEQ